MTTTRIRKSIYEIQDIYDNTPTEDKGGTELVKIILAFQKIQQGLNSPFFKIAGYHGAPFRGAGWGNNQWWGGYCNHGNILFPTWHRAYVLELEDALHEAMKDDSDFATVGLPYWDEISSNAVGAGLPHILTDKNVDIGNNTIIVNPLRSYTFPQWVYDNAAPDPANYTKPKEYQTVRYPYSGLVGTDADEAATKEHNDDVDAQATSAGTTTDAFLNGNITHWLNYGKNGGASIYQKFIQCLDAPNYTVFSNTTSAAQYNQVGQDQAGHVNVVALESPHNSMHLAIGGIDLPGSQFGLIRGANGDMGENDTASFDPVFFFHHCFIDKVFWDWQVKKGQTSELTIEPEYARYPGTNSVDSQGPTPWVAGNTLLTLDSPLEPFLKPGTQDFRTSKDVVDISKLGYKFQESSDEDNTNPLVPPNIPGNPPARVVPIQISQHQRTQAIRISGINRAEFRGSFAVYVEANVSQEEGGEDWKVVDAEGILSRWNIGGCANCQSHLNVTTYLSLPHTFSKRFLDDKVKHSKIENYVRVAVRHKQAATTGRDDGRLGRQDEGIKKKLEYHRHWQVISR